MRSNGLIVVSVSILVLTALIALAGMVTRQPDVLVDERGSQSADRLRVYTAAGTKGPMEEIVFAYERDYGVGVDLQYGGSGSLLANIALSGSGDAFLSADRHHMDEAKRQGLVEEVIEVARQHPVLAVAAGNPKGITGFQDVLDRKLRFALANPEAAAIGHMTRDALGESGQWEEAKEAAVVTKPTVNEIATDLTIGAVDAAIIWDSTVALMNTNGSVLEIVSTPELAGYSSEVVLGILASTEQPTRSLHFGRYMAAPEKGGAVFGGNGFASGNGDSWAEQPEIVFYSGMVNRPAIQAGLDAFSAREGVRITTKWNGCGVLTADMRDIVERRRQGADLAVPDVYYTCDGTYLGPVTDLFNTARVMSETDLVIAVPEGNPKGITSLDDLAKPGVRVGVSHAQQSTLGWLTIHLLSTESLLEAVRANIAVENPQADFLMNHVRIGKLDAVVVYAVSVQAHPEGVESIPVDSKAARAVQTYSIGKESAYPALATRLRTFLHQDKAAFDSVGLRWRQEGDRASTSFVVPGGPGSD